MTPPYCSPERWDYLVAPCRDLDYEVNGQGPTVAPLDRGGVAPALVPPPEGRCAPDSKGGA